MCVVYWRGVHGGNACALTVHVHSQSEGVRPHNIARCNLVLPTVIASDVSQTCSGDSEPCVSDRCTLVGGGLASMEKEILSCPEHWRVRTEGDLKSRGTCTSVIAGQHVYIRIITTYSNTTHNSGQVRTGRACMGEPHPQPVRGDHSDQLSPHNPRKCS